MDIKGTTKTGFEFVVDEGIRDDMELLELLIAVDKGDWTVTPELVRSLFGDEQKKALYDHCRGENGRVSAEKVFAEIKAVFDAIKNSDEESDLKN